MKIGLIFTSFGMPEYFQESIKQWIEAKNRHDLRIAIVSLPFKEYVMLNPSDDVTISEAKGLLEQGKINHLITEPKFIPEWEARQLALEKLLSDGCEIIGQADGDEFPTAEEIDRTFNYLKDNPWITWFKGNYRNYVFDENSYLEDSFTPPRWYRVIAGQYRMARFSYDNDIAYVDKEGRLISHLALSSLTIPSRIQNIRHLTWLNNARTRNKILYQATRWGSLDGCSYAWDDSKGGLIWNDSFFKKTGQSIPRIVKQTT
jgi:hypothetical protein